MVETSLFPPPGSVHGECIHHVLLQKPQEAGAPGFCSNGFQTSLRGLMDVKTSFLLIQPLTIQLGLKEETISLSALRINATAVFAAAAGIPLAGNSPPIGV